MHSLDGAFTLRGAERSEEGGVRPERIWAVSEKIDDEVSGEDFWRS